MFMLKHLSNPSTDYSVSTSASHSRSRSVYARLPTSTSQPSNLPTSASLSSLRSQTFAIPSRRNHVLVVLFVSFGMMMIVLLCLDGPPAGRGGSTWQGAVYVGSGLFSSHRGALMKNLTVHDHPTKTFRENLWPDKQYITSWGNAGFTNDFISYMNTIYLAVATERIPILPPISRSHHVDAPEPFYLGSVFDLPRMSDEIAHPLLEWADVKIAARRGYNTSWWFESKFLPDREPEEGEKGRDDVEDKPANEGGDQSEDGERAERDEPIDTEEGEPEEVREEEKHKPKYPEVDDPELELLGCWSPWWQTSDDDAPRWSNIPENIMIDLSYTRAPHSVSFPKGGAGTSMAGLVALGYEKGYQEGMQEHSAIPSKYREQTAAPDQQLYCLDYLFFLSMLWQKDAFLSDHAPVWRHVARHAHFLPEIEDMARGYVRRALGLAVRAKIPKFIAIHVRRGDFASWCPHETEEECLPQLSAFARRIDEVRMELGERESHRRFWPQASFHHHHGRSTAALTPRFAWYGSPSRILSVQNWGKEIPILVTSDEPVTEESAFWKDVKGRGWIAIDHTKEDTVQKHGVWYPLVIDQAIHSLAIGFVGTDQSTMSVVGGLRVRDWNHGAIRMVKWGKQESDAH